MVRGPRYTRDQAAEAISASLTYTEALRRLGMCPTGGNSATLKRYAEGPWAISVAHFDPDAARRLRRKAQPLADVLVEGSTYGRAHLKRRLFAEGLKERRCEHCGQGETWHGRRLSLVLDHVNGVRDDHRLENLRILCPNCNATLDTHCGRRNRMARREVECAWCGASFSPRVPAQRYCSRACGQHAPKPAGRRVTRPELDELFEQVTRDGWSATGRRHGVSPTTIRRWVASGTRPGAVRA